MKSEAIKPGVMVQVIRGAYAGQRGTVAASTRDGNVLVDDWDRRERNRIYRVPAVDVVEL